MLPDGLPHEELRRLARRSDGAGLARLVPHLVLMAASAALVLWSRGHAWLVPAMFLLGLTEVALFAPLHETTHDTPFRTPWLNRGVGLLAGFLLILPPQGFRLFHRAHHRYTQDPRRDPELFDVQPLTRQRYWLQLSGLVYWVGQVRTLLATASGRAGQPWIPPDQRSAVIREARLFLLAYLLMALVATRTAYPWLLWVAPVLLAQPVLRWILMAEHGQCPQTADPWINTRTTHSAMLVRSLFWNANYHAEHHLAPGVPFHALPALHALVATRLRCIAPGYRAAHRDIRAALPVGS